LWLLKISDFSNYGLDEGIDYEFLEFKTLSSITSIYAFDVVPNGFKLRGSQSSTNNSGDTIIFDAWCGTAIKHGNGK
jgi:hypothetical protein|tara:strand:+ start:236 stop:466 length:231 start_codon:yes stop_codon:yes gene_type:complete